jgi:hypothetical protein
MGRVVNVLMDLCLILFPSLVTHVKFLFASSVYPVSLHAALAMQAAHRHPAPVLLLLRLISILEETAALFATTLA